MDQAQKIKKLPGLSIQAMISSYVWVKSNFFEYLEKIFSRKRL